MKLYWLSGKYHCPVTYRIFNENSHIVAIRTSGNILSYEVGSGSDLLTDLWMYANDILSGQMFVSFWARSTENLFIFMSVNYACLNHVLQNSAG